jgi:predicted  nucleic acid-binding Zn-ribbon protein
MATPMEKIHELQREFNTLVERVSTLVRDVTEAKERQKEADKVAQDLRQELATEKKEHAVLRTEFNELKERFKTKEAWFRGLVASVVVASLASMVSLIVALTRK